MGNIIQSLAFPYPNPPNQLFTEPLYTKNAAGNRIPLLYYPYQNPDDDNEAEKLIIFSHGNAEDLGIIEGELSHLRDVLKCSLLGYEYLGYGHSVPAKTNATSCQSGPSYPSEDGCYQSIDMAYEYTKSVLKIKPQNIFIMGQSIGSGPSCELAMKLCRANENIGGLILISPFKSAVKVITEYLGPIGWAVDFFKNEHKIPHITVPILIIHGELDNVVSIDHGRYLHTLCSNTSRKKLHCIKNTGHNDIMDRRECLQEIKTFIQT